jgi:hypothetical protein
MFYLLPAGLDFRGCCAQTCEANSWSRRERKLSFIASKFTPTGGPVGSNSHPHSEQPQERKSSRLIVVISRGIGELPAMDFVVCRGVRLA